MILNRFFILLLSMIFVLNGNISSAETIQMIDNEDTLVLSSDTLRKPVEEEKFRYRKSKRFTAALLCLTLGPFGMHRLYLGTTPRVAAAYSVTLGGIGIIPFIDLLAITFSKDISEFKNNSRFIMWGKE